jgi:hypothetical protein
MFKLRVKTIDARKRAKVKEGCFKRFVGVHRNMAERVGMEYLVTTPGVAEQEAQRLLPAH